MTKGKNFSANNAKGQRKKSDFYETPYSITEHLLEVEPFDYTKTVCDVTAYDIEKNFLFDTKEYDYIITNPPFSLAYEFICKSKSLAKEKFAMLLPLSYLHGKKRHDDVYSDREYGLKKVYVFTRYPMLGDPLRKDGKYNTGMMVYAWYIFENHYSGLPTIDWIDNNSDVLSKKDRA
jgi:hypothetical protein